MTITLETIIKKSILPLTFISIWCWLVWQFAHSLHQAELWKTWMMAGFPFGIRRESVWLIPRNFDIGGTVGVWAINIIVGSLIGGFVVIWQVMRAFYILVKECLSQLIRVRK
ncbi:MAG: DUF6050 family protein [Anaerostipes sp.]|nr:DUF6050 family protein [Anaerostipes sp.]